MKINSYIKIFTNTLIFSLIYCGSPEGVVYSFYDFYNPDSSNSVRFNNYTLGVYGGGYSTIEIKGKEILRYQIRNVVAGRWVNIDSLILVSNEPPLIQKLADTNIKIKLFTEMNNRFLGDPEFVIFDRKVSKVDDK